MKNTPIKVLLLTGYLGSGKTTLLNRILNNREGIRFAVIVNDIGEVNIDADLIAKGGIVNTADDSLVPLQNGCICCSLRTDLAQQLVDLASTGRFDYIVIEASGICEPEPIAQTICSLPMMGEDFTKGVEIELDCIASVVDTLRLRDEFGMGKDLQRPGIEEHDIESLVIQQIEFCNIILLNKISEVTREDAAEIKAVVKAIQPAAEIFECNYCDIPLDKLLNTGMFDFERVATSATWIREIEKQEDIENVESEHHDHHEHEEHDDHEHHHHHHHEDGHSHQEEFGISTFVYFARKPFSLNKFDYYCAKKWPKSIIRAKGICYFAENPDMSYLFEQAGTQKRLIEAGKWYATAPEEDLRILLTRDPGLMRDWDAEYGDRMEKIVFIGKNMDKDSIIAQLDECLD